MTTPANLKGYRVMTLPGDGVGPEIVDAAKRVLDAAGEKFGYLLAYEVGIMGGCAIDEFGQPLEPGLVERCQATDAVLLGGCDETTEPNQVFSWMNLGRAFAELQMGAELYCLHKNKWWQTSRGPLLDAGAFVAGLEYATGVDATILGKPSASYFAAALAALDAEPELTWMVSDDLEADVRGAQSFGMRTALVRTGKFRPEVLDHSGVVPEIVLSSVAQFPEWLERSL